MPLDPQVGDGAGLEGPEPGQADRSEEARSSGVISDLPASKSTVRGRPARRRLDRAAMRGDHRAELRRRAGHRRPARGGRLQPPGDPLGHLLRRRCPPFVAADEVLELAPFLVRGLRERSDPGGGRPERDNALELRLDDRIGRVEAGVLSLRAVSRTAACSAAGSAAKSFVASSSCLSSDRQSIISIRSTKASSMNASATVRPMTAPRRYWRVPSAGSGNRLDMRLLPRPRNGHRPPSAGRPAGRSRAASAASRRRPPPPPPVRTPAASIARRLPPARGQTSPAPRHTGPDRLDLVRHAPARAIAARRSRRAASSPPARRAPADCAAANSPMAPLFPRATPDRRLRRRRRAGHAVADLLTAPRRLVQRPASVAV